jgi:hypothetical protein
LDHIQLVVRNKRNRAGRIQSCQSAHRNLS